jgi:phosphopantetheine adenylyltransferase
MRFVNDFKKDVNVVYITCDRDFEHISSSAIRKLQSFSPGSGDRYLI